MRKETHCRHIGYSFRLTARVLLYASSHRQDSTYHGLWYTSRGALAGTRNSSMGPPHEGSIRRPIAPRANALTTELHLAPWLMRYNRKENVLSASLSKTFPSLLPTKNVFLKAQWVGVMSLHSHLSLTPNKHTNSLCPGQRA